MSHALKLSRQERKQLIRKADAALEDANQAAERLLERVKSIRLTAEDLEHEVEGDGRAR